MPGRRKKYELAVKDLRWLCDPALFGARNSKGLKPLDQIIGQGRALKAIRLGLEVKSPGYNIYVAGLTGTGRTTTIKRFLEQIDTNTKIPDDICYVNNFNNPDLPLVIYLPAGKGKEFCKDVDNTIRFIRESLPAIFESEQFQERSKKNLEKFAKRSRELFAQLEEKIEKEGFAVVKVEMGPASHPEIFPVFEDNVVNWDQIAQLIKENKLSEKDFEKLKQKHAELTEELQDTLRAVRNINRDAAQAMEALRVDVVTPVVTGVIEDLKMKYAGEKIANYLENVKSDILEHLDEFKLAEPGAEVPPGMLLPVQKSDIFQKYKVNLIVDNSELKKVPVVIEHSPSYKNLFGTIERVVDQSGVWRTDFTKIKVGSLVRANGGFLVLNLLDTLVEPGVWTALKRTLKNHQVDIQAYDPFYMVSTSAMKPEPIQVDLKVVIIGESDYYYRLYYLDEDFQKIFKVRADFDTVMPLSDTAITDYGRFISRICAEEGHLALDKNAMAAIVEYGVLIAGNRKKIATKFSDIADLVREADYWARSAGVKQVTRKYVDQALTEKIYRCQLIEEKIKEMIAEGHIKIESKGAEVGQVNGLAVHEVGEYSFGRPSRITAKVGAGHSGIISIDREADLSGKTHTKGVAILTGYFRGKYAAKRQLNMSVSVAFEQTYGYVDGDSASSTEIYAIISALSAVPFRQDIAITGSVDQNGTIQPIGGVNQKIEGFFDVCKLRGLTGTQGVMIPVQNVNNLMLRKDVVDAVRLGKFHIYAIENVDQGIEILSGRKAGVRGKDGKFSRNSISWLVEKRLRELSEKETKAKEKGKGTKKAKKKARKEAKHEPGSEE